MNQFTTDCKKLERVIESCKTTDQMKAAWRYYMLWEKKHDIDRMPRSAYIQWSNTVGFCSGYFHGWLNGCNSVATRMTSAKPSNPKYEPLRHKLNKTQAQKEEGSDNRKQPL